MGRKKKKFKPIIFCYYCDRTFENEKVLIQHQRAKHFKCIVCHKRLGSAHGMMVHVFQVHKQQIDKVPHAKEGRDSFHIDIFGMSNIPQQVIDEKHAERGEPPTKRQKLLLPIQQTPIQQLQQQPPPPQINHHPMFPNPMINPMMNQMMMAPMMMAMPPPPSPFNHYINNQHHHHLHPHPHPHQHPHQHQHPIHPPYPHLPHPPHPSHSHSHTLHSHHPPPNITIIQQPQQQQPQQPSSPNNKNYEMNGGNGMASIEIKQNENIIERERESGNIINTKKNNKKNHLLYTNEMISMEEQRFLHSNYYWTTNKQQTQQ